MEFLQTISELGVENLNIIFPLVAVLTRVSVFAFLLPGLGETAISVRIRLLIALMITFLVAPLVGLTSVVGWTLSDLALLIAMEAFYGFVLGFGLRVMVFALQIAGAVISQSLSLTQVFGGGMTSEPNTSVGTILMMGGVTLLVTLDLHMRAIGLLIGTYETFPLLQLDGTHTSMVSRPDIEEITYWVVQKSISVFNFAVALALPFLVLNFIYNLILGFVNKAMPQLMVSFVGMPFITGVGIVLLALSIAGILTAWLGAYNGLMADML